MRMDNQLGSGNRQRTLRIEAKGKAGKEKGVGTMNPLNSRKVISGAREFA